MNVKIGSLRRNGFLMVPEKELKRNRKGIDYENSGVVMRG